MSRWQRRVRWVLLVFGVVFAVGVAMRFKRREPPPPAAPVVRSDPGALVESTKGNLLSVKGSREDFSVDYERQLTYADGTSKLVNVTIVSKEKNGDRTFTVTAKQGRVTQSQSDIELEGDVRLSGSDGMAASTERATYAQAEGAIRAPGPVSFSKGRLRANGVGMTYERGRDLLTILDQAVVSMAADTAGANATTMTAGTAAFARKDRFVRLEKSAHVQRTNETIEADTLTAYLSEDEKRIQNVELRSNSRITTPNAAVGALRSLSGQDMNLSYAADGQALEHALIVGGATIQLAGEKGKPGRQIAAGTLDVSLAPDGATPTALVGRNDVALTFPAESGSPERVIRAQNLDGRGEAGKGLTHALFTGSVQFRERGGQTNREARSGSLDVGLKPGLSAIDVASFAHVVRFEDGRLSAMSAAARYDLEKGTLALSGSEPGSDVPRVVNEQIIVDAATIDLTLAGPKLKASGTPVKSQLLPAKKSAKPGEGNDVKMPAMLKADQPVIVLANALDYDGATSHGVYTGAAWLSQGETSIKGDTITLDDKAGDLSASGSVTTTTMQTQTGKDKKPERVPSIGRSKDLKYEDGPRRLTYTGDAHLSGPDGDMTANKVELYLKTSGDELDRAEAYENVTLVEQNRKTTGARMTYLTKDESYLVTGTPVSIIDECQRETRGRSLRFLKATDTILVDGNQQMRTQTKGNGKCPGS